jgi:nicotinamide-nucleotide amidase
MRLNLLLTGNELMAGDTIDSNSAMIAEAVAAYGWRIHKKVTVGDDLELLCKEIDALCANTDVLIINGGLGPTVDDMTAQALAQLTQRQIVEHPQALAHLESWCGKRGFSLNAANLKQAMLPENCDIIANARGSAVGIGLTHRDCLVLATPGVPSELRVMLEQEIIPLTTSRFKTGFVQTIRLGVFGLGESNIQEMINSAFPDWPEDIELGFRASMPVLEVKLTIWQDGIEEKLALWKTRLEALLADHLLGEMPITLAEACLDTLREHQLQLGTAESCTGGLIASQITRIPGASSQFPGGIVSYSNAMKRSALNVSQATLEAHGAVSEQTAREMVLGALTATQADIAVAVTGVAGPDGGSEDKPVGTVWLAWGTRSSIKACCLCLPYDRQGFQNWVAALALDLVRREVKGLPALPQIVLRYLRHPARPEAII